MCRCGEPWDLDTVLHDEPQEFARQGCLVHGCPCCRTAPPPRLTDEQRDWLQAVAELAVQFGDDLDGFAAFLEDLQLVSG